MEQRLQTISSNLETLIACPDCDLLMNRIKPEHGQKIICPRCGRLLLKHCNNTVQRSLAISLAGILLFFPANLMPLMTVRTLGMSESGNILQTILTFWQKEYYFVAAAVFFSTILFPLIKLGSLAIVSLSLLLKKPSRALGRIFKLCSLLEEWAMVEVFLLGIMITIIKMHHSTEIHFETGFYCFVGLVILTVSSCLVTCRESFWALLDNNGKSLTETLVLPLQNLKTTAAESGLLRCQNCGKLTPLPADAGGHSRCSRCETPLHLRKPQSLIRTSALIISAALFLLPANLMPIMRVEFLGIPSSSTIIDGIMLFYEDGSYFIAFIILCASILIPLFKIVGLTITLLTITLNRPHFLRQKTIMFRFIEFIGRWSMLDIFVIALLGCFINFSFFTSIETAPAATYFCLVVITTMIAAITFDPRIMWDIQRKTGDFSPQSDSTTISVPHGGHQS